jgi:hypothetical protein
MACETVRQGAAVLKRYGFQINFLTRSHEAHVAGFRRNREVLTASLRRGKPFEPLFVPARLKLPDCQHPNKQLSASLAQP